MLPYLGTRTPWFAFLAHFRDTSDLDQFAGSAFLRAHSSSEVEFQAKMCSLHRWLAQRLHLGSLPSVAS
jgi:hypothetical protein